MTQPVFNLQTPIATGTQMLVPMYPHAGIEAGTIPATFTYGMDGTGSNVGSIYGADRFTMVSN